MTTIVLPKLQHAHVTFHVSQKLNFSELMGKVETELMSLVSRLSQNPEEIAGSRKNTLPLLFQSLIEDQNYALLENTGTKVVFELTNLPSDFIVDTAGALHQATASLTKVGPEFLVDRFYLAKQTTNHAAGPGPGRSGPKP